MANNTCPTSAKLLDGQELWHTYEWNLKKSPNISALCGLIEEFLAKDSGNKKLGTKGGVLGPILRNKVILCWIGKANWLVSRSAGRDEGTGVLGQRLTPQLCSMLGWETGRWKEERLQGVAQGGMWRMEARGRFWLFPLLPDNLLSFLPGKQLLAQCIDSTGSEDPLLMAGYVTQGEPQLLLFLRSSSIRLSTMDSSPEWWRLCRVPTFPRSIPAIFKCKPSPHEGDFKRSFIRADRSVSPRRGRISQRLPGILGQDTAPPPWLHPQSILYLG